MRQALAVVLVCPLLVAGPAVGEPQDDSARLLAALNDKVRSTLQESRARHDDLAQRLEILDQLLEGIETIALQGGSLHVGEARRKLEEARTRAARPAPLEAPVPGVLDRLGALLGLLSTPNSGQGRATYFWTAGALEENVLELAEGLRVEAGSVGGLAATLRQADEGGLRGVTLEGLRTSVRARKAALGLRSPRRQGRGERN
jgi:hypothetical protein